MGALWFPIFLMFVAAAYSAFAVAAAHKPGKQHPLVKKCSASAARWFVLATLAYAAAGVLLIAPVPSAIAVCCAFLALVACTAGYIAAGGGK